MCGQQYINVEGHPVCRRSPNSSGVRPQLRRKTEGIVGERKVPVRGGVHECVKAGDSNSLVSPQKFALDLVIDDGRNHNASTGNKTILEPVRDGDHFLAALRLRYQAELARIEKKNVVHE